MSLSARLLAGLLVCLSAFLSGYFVGKEDERTDQLAAQVASADRAIEVHNEAATAGQTVERKAVRRSEKTEAVFSGISLGVIDYAKEHPADGDCHLGTDGMRLWSAANAGAEAESSVDGFGPMPAASPTREPEHDGPAGKSRSGGSAVPPLQGSAPSVDRLAGGDD